MVVLKNLTVGKKLIVSRLNIALAVLLKNNKIFDWKDKGRSTIRQLPKKI